MLRRVRVNRRQNVIEEKSFRARVHRAGEGDARFLPAGQVDAALADLGRVAVLEDVEVGGEGASVEDGVVADLVVGKAEEDVVWGRWSVIVKGGGRGGEVEQGWTHP